MRRFQAVLTAVLIAIALLGSASAQSRTIRLDGWIQWISGERIMLALDSGQSITIELRDVPQDQYMGLRARDRILVVGALSADNRRVAATSVAFIEAGWADQSP